MEKNGNEYDKKADEATEAPGEGADTDPGEETERAEK